MFYDKAVSKLGMHLTVSSFSGWSERGQKGRGGHRAEAGRPRVLAQAHRPHHLRHWGGQELLRARPQPVPAGAQHWPGQFPQELNII